MASSTRAVYAAVASDLAIAVAKFVASALGGSASMAAEGVHSLIDSGNGLLLLWGERAARRPADDLHPFGYGKEQYFWTLIVALMIFTLGGGVTTYEGVQRLLEPGDLEAPWWGYAVLAVAGTFQAYTWVVAYRELRKDVPEGTVLQAAQASKDPSTFAVLFEDTTALLGVAVALAGVFLSHWTGSPYPDGVASVLVGLIMAAVAVMLAYESKKLLVGESTDEATRDRIRDTAGGDPAVVRVGQVLTMHLGPEEVLLNIDLEFRSGLSTDELGGAIDRVERAIRGTAPEVKRIFIEAEFLGAAHQGTAPGP